MTIRLLRYAVIVLGLFMTVGCEPAYRWQLLRKADGQSANVGSFIYRGQCEAERRRIARRDFVYEYVCVHE